MAPDSLGAYLFSKGFRISLFRSFFKPFVQFVYAIPRSKQPNEDEQLGNILAERAEGNGDDKQKNYVEKYAYSGITANQVFDIHDLLFPSQT